MATARVDDIGSKRVYVAGGRHKGKAGEKTVPVSREKTQMDYGAKGSWVGLEEARLAALAARKARLAANRAAAELYESSGRLLLRPIQ